MDSPRSLQNRLEPAELNRLEEHDLSRSNRQTAGSNQETDHIHNNSRSHGRTPKRTAQENQEEGRTSDRPSHAGLTPIARPRERSQRQGTGAFLQSRGRLRACYRDRERGRQGLLFRLRLMNPKLRL